MNIETSLDSARVMRSYDSSRDSVWQHISSPTTRELWWPKSVLELTPGGKIVAELTQRDGSPCSLSGTMDVCLDGHALGFDWRRPEDRERTSVLITLTSLLGSTQVTVYEIGFRTLPESANRIREATDHWSACLEALGATFSMPAQ